MDEKIIREQYTKYESHYHDLQNETFELVNKIVKDDKYSHVDVAEVKKRPNSKIKEIDAICVNNKREDKYNECEKLFDIKDIAGVRVICHCEEDLIFLAEIIQNVLNDNKYRYIEREDKGGSVANSNGKSRPSYRAIHITFSKRYKGQNIYCEIQLRTVMGDAWAVQDRKYIYGQKLKDEGARDTLADSVAEIMNGCEGLWSLVKKEYKKDYSINHEDIKITREANKTEKIEQKGAKEFDADLSKDNL